MEVNNKGTQKGVQGMCVMKSCDGPAKVLYRLKQFDVEQCSSCGMRFRQPFPTESDLRNMYEDPAFYSSPYFGDQYNPTQRLLRPEVKIFREALAWLETHMDEANGHRHTLLDVGCGNGFFLSLANERGWRAEGVELSGPLVARATREFGLDVHNGDFLNVQLPSSAFNVITMWDFLEHVIDPEAVLRRARDLLMPRGYLLIFTIDASSLFNVLGGLWYKLSVGRARLPLELLYDARHNYYFTRKSLHSLVDRSRFRVVATKGYRAYLGRWLIAPAPALVRRAGDLVDFISVVANRKYRQLIYCTVEK